MCCPRSCPSSCCTNSRPSPQSCPPPQIYCVKPAFACSRCPPNSLYTCNILGTGNRPKPQCCQSSRSNFCSDIMQCASSSPPPPPPPPPPGCCIRSVSFSPQISPNRCCASACSSPTFCPPQMTRSTSFCGDSGGNKCCQSTPCPGRPFCPKRPPCPRPNNSQCWSVGGSLKISVWVFSFEFYLSSHFLFSFLFNIQIC